MQLSFIGEPTGIHRNTSDNSIRSNEGGNHNEHKLLDIESDDEGNESASNNDGVVNDDVLKRWTKYGGKEEPKHNTTEGSNERDTPLSLLGN